MSITVLKESLATQEDLTTATTAAVRKYPLGHKVKVYNDLYECEQEFIYLYASTGQATAYTPYVITYGSTTGTEVQTLTPIATAGSTGGLGGNIGEICVPQITCTSGMYFFAQTKGICIGVAAATTITAGTLVGVTATAPTVFTATTNTVTLSQGSNRFGVVKTAATTAAVTAYINLFGRAGLVTTA